MRYQINPRDFDWFDISANLHSGVFIDDDFSQISEPYFRYGFTISKEISRFQPYFGYYLNDSYLLENKRDRESKSVYCFGIAIPNKDGLIFIECNHYNYGSGSSDGYYTFGIGLRATLSSGE